MPILLLDPYTGIRIKCVLYKMDMIKMRFKEFLYLQQTKFVLCRIAIEKNTICLPHILVRNPIKSAIEISKFLFDFSPFH